MNSLVEENYLKALFSLSNDKGEVSVNELSKRLEIKMPTVTSMMKKLALKKLVRYEKYKPIQLTVEGKQRAILIVRKHRLTEMFLAEVMGFGWEEVHDIAEQIEHVDSPIFFKRMDELLGHPSFDPHGSPIPDNNGNIQEKQYRALSECKKGDKVKFMAVSNSSEGLLVFLNSKKLQLDSMIEVLSVEAFDGSLSISYSKGQKVTLSKIVGDKILVMDKDK